MKSESGNGASFNGTGGRHQRDRHPAAHGVDQPEPRRSRQVLELQDPLGDRPRGQQIRPQGARQQPAGDRWGDQVPVHLGHEIADGQFGQLAALVPEQDVEGRLTGSSGRRKVCRDLPAVALVAPAPGRLVP